jgi:uncharacterized LabA/DUF88 family protein
LLRQCAGLFFLAILFPVVYNKIIMKKRAFVAIDGSDLYHRLKEKQVDLRNLLNFDYTGFAKFLAEKDKLVRKGYYVGLVRAKPGQKKALKMMANQHRLLTKLKKDGWDLFYGYLLKSGGKYHEKGVDVKIAVDIVVGAYENLYDRLILVSSDTDLLPALEVVRRRKKEIEYVGFSHTPSHAMIEYATETRLLRKDDLVPFVGDEGL